MNPPQARYEFGEFVLDVGRQRLSRSASGEVVPLAAKAFDMLAFLVEHAGEALDKETLLRTLWPGVIVEENSLAQCISTLRQALGETRHDNRYIATLARKGYRFVAPVTRCEAPDAMPESPAPAQRTASGRYRVLLVLGLIGAVMLVALGVWRDPAEAPVAAPAAPTLAVLPFKALVPADSDPSLEMGMADSLIGALGAADGYAVTPLSSVRQFALRDVEPLAAGRELGVGHVLEGSLQRSADRLRVSVRLLRVVDGRLLWTQTFDERFTDVFQIQDSIAARIRTALAVAAPSRDPVRSGRTRDPEAYALYARGRYAWTRQTESSLRSAIGHYEQAIARDPEYALAYAGLSDSYALLGVLGIEAPHDVFPLARTAAEHALALDPDLASAHSALGHVQLQYEHNATAAAASYEKASALDPALALNEHRRSLLFAMQGDTERALATSMHAQQLEPLWLAVRASPGNFLYYAGRFKEAIAVAENVLALNDDADNARCMLIRNLIATGDHARALRELDRAPLQMPGSHALRAQALALSGNRAEAAEELARVMALSDRRYVAAYDIALIHAALADSESTFLWLERAIQDRSTLLVFLAQEPMFAALRDDPRFDALVARVGIARATGK
ncbi:winged helix-turn-helix domain-containing protein [Tahibacter sp.]|uniref:winged helix-turn-helix domain-containing protein n=1 Tax=Tahibacter sp. TaxID=2056211 RepID=UPI0028C4EB97|nr:winged helix-turn-helix domain-containing protein [Tahibacter sp.]